MNKIWRRWKGKFNCYEYRDEQEIALGAAQPRVEDGWEEFELASRPAAAAPTAEQILALERRSPMSDDEALRFGRAVLLLAERAAAAAPAVGVTALHEALQFYANGDHFTKHDPNAWDNVSGEPANLWEDEANTATVEDGSIARAALAGAAQPRCPYCDGTGDVHSPDGQWRGVCTCPAGVAQGAEPPDHFPPREAFIWNLGFRAGAETATLDVVQAAADASSVGHLSALLDIQTALLGRAMAVMKAVEGAASPANEGSGDFTATIPYGAWAEFVDARAGLLYAVAQSPIGASPQPTGTEKKA